jgi:hypothetical protein
MLNSKALRSQDRMSVFRKSNILLQIKEEESGDMLQVEITGYDFYTMVLTFEQLHLTSCWPSSLSRSI